MRYTTTDCVKPQLRAEQFLNTRVESTINFVKVKQKNSVSSTTSKARFAHNFHPVLATLELCLSFYTHRKLPTKSRHTSQRLDTPWSCQYCHVQSCFCFSSTWGVLLNLYCRTQWWWSRRQLQHSARHLCTPSHRSAPLETEIDATVRMASL